MLKVGKNVFVHIFTMSGKEVNTRNYGKSFEIVENGGVMGIVWKDTNFSPFATFTSNVIFEDTETMEKYRHSQISGKLERA